MMNRCSRVWLTAGSRRSFTLVELLIVVLILGILASVVVPMFADASSEAATSTVQSDLQVMRHAIQMYFVEHKGGYPGALTALARYTSEAGAMSTSKSATYKYGLYIRAIPPCPVGPYKGATGWAAANANPPTVVSNTPTVGWLYHWQTGGVWVNDINNLDK
jgi:prepilin-type N-terminal cleavage/methylation domain-containing protein